MKNLLKIATVFALVCLSMGQAQAAEKILVVTEYYEKYTEKDGTGYYYEIISHIFKDYDVTFKIYPFARSVAMVKSGKADIVLGVYEGDLPDKHLSAKPIEIDRPDLITKPELVANWKGLESLKGKKVGALIDYALGCRPVCEHAIAS